jgi:hypothetical protein
MSTMAVLCDSTSYRDYLAALEGFQQSLDNHNNLGMSIPNSKLFIW